MSISRFFRESKFFKLKLSHAVKLVSHFFTETLTDLSL
nr:MAG TPA: hypothetical protein [Caudoviricetes sp.]